MSIPDLDLAGGNLTIRYGKGGRIRRLMKRNKAVNLVLCYLMHRRCPQEVPAIGSDVKRDWPPTAGFAPTGTSL
jgi:hypothetical protein